MSDAITVLRVVLVEDDQDLAELISMWLRQLGHKVSVAHAGPDGVEVIVAERPDVVLCDLGLPGMDGVEVCRRVADVMEAPPVMVALTGWRMDREERRTLGAGFRHYLEKPFEAEHLRRVLQSIGDATTSSPSGRVTIL